MEHNKYRNLVIGLIITCIVMAIIIIIILLILSIKNEENNNINTNNITSQTVNSITNNEISNNITNEINDFEEELILNKTIHRVDSEAEYYTTESSIQRFILYSKVGNIQAISALSDEENTFDVNDLSAKLNIEEMYSIDNENGTIYFTNINLGNNTYYLLVIHDHTNSTFKIASLSNEQYNNIINGNADNEYNKYIAVQKNNYNSINYINLRNEDISRKYLASYIQNARYNPEEAYNSLDEEYRKNRFGNYNAFLAYLNEENKSSQLASLDPSSIKDREEFSSDAEYNEYLATNPQKSLKNYQMYTENDKRYCICLDPYGNYYIFEIDGVMNYKLYLDTYTVDLNYFTSKYNDASASTITQLNIERIFEAINNKDYTYVYNKLADNNIFEDYQTMVDYLENNLFKNNKLEFDNYSTNDEKTAYSVTITDGNVINSNEITATIELELGEGYDYKITSIKIQKEGE